DKKGFSGFIVEAAKNKLYRVQIGAFASRQNVQNYLARAKQKGVDGFIVEVEK
ncbi:MAG: SPOR domain-containing protein, partial [Oscillospiraceae bacterium]|nr:SPOR domain-containing protein [Oscillospiraceae bacterium]